MGIVLVTKELREQLKSIEAAINRDLKRHGLSIADLLPTSGSGKNTKYSFTILSGDGSLRLTKNQEVQLRNVLRKHLSFKKGGAR